MADAATVEWDVEVGKEAALQQVKSDADSLPSRCGGDAAGTASQVSS